MSPLLTRTARSLTVAWLLARRNIVSEFQSSRLSPLWPIGFPAAYTALFLLLRPVITPGQAVSSTEFAVFVFAGFCLWHSWFETLRGQMEVIRANKSLVSRGEIGLATLLASRLIEGLANGLPRAVLASLAAMLLIGASLGEALWFLFGTALVIGNAAAIGGMLAPFAALMSDLGKVIQSVSLALLVTGAVFLPLPDDVDGFALWLLQANPLGALLNVARAPMMGDAWLAPEAAVIWSTVSLLIALAIVLLGRRILPVVIERLGN